MSSAASSSSGGDSVAADANAKVAAQLTAIESALANQSAAVSTQSLAAEVLLKHKLSTGRSRNAKLLSDAIKQQDYQDHVKKVAASKQDSELKAKLAAGGAGRLNRLRAGGSSAVVGSETNTPTAAAASSSLAAASSFVAVTPQMTPSHSGVAAVAESAQGGTIVDAALAAVFAAEEARETALSSGLSESAARAAQQQAATAALTPDQRSNEQLMQLLREMTDAEASTQVAQARQLSAADDALMAKLKKGKSTAQQKIIEKAFQHQGLVENFAGLEQQRQADSMAAKLAAGKKKKKADAGDDGAGSAASNSSVAVVDEALRVLETLAELKDEALAEGKIRTAADAKRAEAAALESTLTEEQKSNDTFMKMLKQMTEAEASKEVANARQMSSAEDAMLRKLMKGKTTAQQKLIERAFQDSQFVEDVQKAASKGQEDAMHAKLAAGKKKRAEKKAAEEEKQQAAGAGGDADAAAAAAAAEAARKKKAGSKLKQAVAAAADSSAQLDTMVAAVILLEGARDRAAKDGGRPVRPEEVEAAAQQSVEEHLNEEQQSAHADFLAGLRTTLADASKRSSLTRVLGGGEEALLRKLKQGKTLKQHAQLERAFRDTATVAKLQALEQQKADDAAIARLLQNKAAKKKEVAALAAAADSAAQFDTAVAALAYVEDARDTATAAGLAAPSEAEATAAAHKAAGELLTVDQRGNDTFMDMLRRLVAEASTRPVAPPRTLNATDEAFLRRLMADKPAKMQMQLEVLFRDAALVETLRTLDAQRTADAALAKTLVAKNKKKREAQAAELAAEEAAEAEALEAAAEAAATAEKAPAVSAEVAAAVGVDGAKEFAAMLQQVSVHQANQDLALSRQSELQSEALMKKLLQGKSTKQKKLIEKAFAESGLVEQAVSAQAKRQEDALAAKLAAGKKSKRATAEREEKYAEPLAPAQAEPAPVVVDYLEQKYGEMLAAEAAAKAAAEAEAAAKTADPAQAVLANQEAIAAATNLGMNAGADGVAVAQVAAAAAALGLSPDQITAAATAAASVSAMGDGSGEADHATFMELFRKATEDAAAEQLRRKQGQASQDDAFMRKLMMGKRTRQQQLVDKQMADILAAQQKALSFQTAQDSDMARRLAAGKKRRTGGALVDEAHRLAAEALANEMSKESLAKSAPASALAEEIAAILAAPTILDELLAVSDAQQEEIEKQARESGNSVESIIEANQEALELDNMAAQLMLEKAREAEANGDAEGAAAFMDMYRRMVDEALQRDNALKRQLSSAEEAMMRKLMKGKSTAQQKLIEKAFRNQSLVDAILNQEASRQAALMEAKLAAGRTRRGGGAGGPPKDEAKAKAAEEAFAKLRKIFLGAIKKLDGAHILRALDEALPLVQEGYLDLNRPVKESGEGMLHQAAKYGRAEVAEWLVTQGGARPNLPNNAQQTPLHFAALALDPDGSDQITPDNAATACMVLIESGADVHASDTSFDTPLSIAARYGFDLSNLANTPQALEALLAQRAKEEALEAEKVMMQMELEGGMMSEVEREEQNKAAIIAAQVAADTAAALADADDAAAAAAAAAAAGGQMIDPTTGLPMSSAQVQLQREELESLMNEERLEILALSSPPGGPLSDPKKTKAANLVFLQLCDLFKDISNPRNEHEAAQLIKASAGLVQEGYLDLSRPVKNKQDGSTLLHAAVFHQKLGLVRQLLQHRADPNKATIQGETPLHLACALVDREPHGKAIVSLLLEAGANASLRDFKTGLSCFEHAPTPALKKWLEEWKPLAERQRLALANQMGSLDELLARNNANLRSAAYTAENSFLDKLMRGKLTKQGKLVDQAMRNNDALEARTLTEQQRQLEAMQARLLKGKARKGGVGPLQMEDLSLSSSLSTGSKAEIAARKKAAFMEDMLLQELSEPTKDKIVMCATKWSDHAEGLAGLDIGVLSKLRGMPIAEALKLLATEIARTQLDQQRLNHAINAPGLDEQQALEYERQFNIADCNHDIYSDLTTNMLEAEKKRQDALREQQAAEAAAGGDGDGAGTEEEVAIQRAKDRLEEIAKRKAAALARAQQNRLPAGMLEQICALFSQYIALNTGYEVEPALILQGALPLDDLQSYQLDVETITTMLAATEVEPAKAFIARQAQVNQAVAGGVQRQLQDENLPLQQREEAELHSKLCESNADLYEKIMGVLSDAPRPLLMEESVELSNAHASESASMAAREAALVHPDTGLSVQMHIQDVVLEQMRELAAEFMGIEATELGDMNADQLQQALAKAGINVDVLDELRKLTEAEAGKWLAKEMAKNEAESEMLKKLLKGKGLSDKKRAELLARQKQLDAAADLYNDLLSTLLSGEKKKYAHLSAEEQLAQDRMLAKLAARRRKQAAQELNERKRRQEEELHHAQEVMRESTGTKVARPVLDDSGEALLNPDGSSQMEMVMVYEAWEGAGPEIVAAELLAKQAIQHQLLMDNPLALESLHALAAEHLGISTSELQLMPPEQLQMLLAEKGVDFNILDYLRTLSSEEAAKHLAKEMARAEAEAKMLRKLLQGKGLTPEKRDELLARQKQLEDNAKLYEDMLRDLLAGEQKKYAHMSDAEKAAHDAMQAKLAQRKARELARLKENQNAVDESSDLLDLFDHLAPKGDYECRVCQTINEAVNRSCKFCKKSRADTLTLPEMVLWHAHRLLHQCSCPMSVVEVVHRSMGPCTKKNFLSFMQATLIACNRDAHVYWDGRGVDADQLGALRSSESELVWAFNEWDVENPRFHAFRDAHLDTITQSFIGWADFRDECVQMPNIQDYQ